MAAKFFVHNLGCKVNRVESDSMIVDLLAAGGQLSARQEAQIIIINTCTVTAEADAKTRKAIRQALASAPTAWVIATGCSVAIDKDLLTALGERVIAEPDRELAKQRALEIMRQENASMHEQNHQFASHRIGAAFNTRLGIKIQDGCDNACTYCIVCVARGAARSIPHADVVRQIVEAENLGVREVVLTGVNIGAYVSAGNNLVALLEMILSATSSLRVRLSSLEPQHADDKLIALIAGSDGRLCAHLHLPLQSGSDKILKLMQRHYDKAFFAERVAYAHKLMPQVAITTDLIVGFPGEGDADFQESLEFCRQMAFARMHVFRYSKRPGTIAATMPNQVSPQLIAQRAKAARELATEMHQNDLQARISTTEKVLVERELQGTSESYHSVILQNIRKNIAVGSLVELNFVGVDKASLLSD